MSALVDKVYTIGNLIEFNENGLFIAPFVDIKRTLIDRMRQLYGVDIDVTDASVDGQWITEIALLLNNILQAFNDLYMNLNPATAQGTALDLLASFSNISRKYATKSVCEIVLTNNIAFSLDPNATFIDANGNIWDIDNDRTDLLPNKNPTTQHYDFSASDMANGVTIPLICSVVGAIRIPANSIIAFTNTDAQNASVMISQPVAGVQGTIDESDAHLRARRNHSSANEAVTIIDGIQGALLVNSNVFDAFVINHTVDGPSGTGILAHTVEVIVRTKYESSTGTNLNKFIADTIYNRLTPGIPSTYDVTTTSAAVDTPEAGKNTLRQLIEPLSTDISTAFFKVSLWAEAEPIKPVIDVTLHKLANCNMSTTSIAVIQAIANYANNLGLLVDLDASALLQEILFADPKFQGRSTFYCTPQNILLANAIFTFKPSKSTNPAAATVSAEVRKTYYDYDDSCTFDSSTNTYKNADNTIIIRYED